VDDNKLKQFIETFVNFDECEKEEAIDMIKARDMKIALWDIAQEIFRPARKHGYSNSKVQDLLDKCGDDGYELVSELEDMFYEILRDRGLGDII